MNNNIRNAIIVWVAIALAWFFISSRWFDVPSSTTVWNNPIVTDGISVNGDGKVYASPDILIANVGITENAPTTKEALANTNNKVKQIIEIATAEWINQKDIQTTNISMYPHYNYINNNSKIDGYDSTQNLSIKIKKLDTVATILDKLSSVEGLQIQNTSYDIDNKDKIYEQARELAYQKAKSKAKQLAELAWIKLGKVISITDVSMDNSYPPVYPMYDRQEVMGMWWASSDSASPIAPGEMVFDMSVSVVYSID